MSMNKQVSLVIPTRNRPDSLMDCVGVALQHAADIEIVVVDNSDTDALRARLAPAIEAGQVRYRYSGEVLSVVANFERGLDEVTGDYVMFIGDDDSIGPGLVEVARWAGSRGIDAVISYRQRFIANYFWPGVSSKFYGDAYAASLFVNGFTGQAHRLEPLNELRAAAADLGGNLQGLPRLYHGLVARRLVDEIRARYGHVFGGVSPDIYNATLVAAQCRQAWCVDYPFVIPGASPPSTAAQGAARNEQGRLDRTEHVTRFGAGLTWNECIPAYYSGPVVWAYSLTMALAQVPELGVVPQYGRLYARCLLSSRRLWRPVLQAWRQLAAQQGAVTAAKGLAAGLAGEVSSLAGRIGRRLMNPGPGGGARRVSGLALISDAYRTLQQESARTPLQLP